jgi:hypothetical protein
VGMTLGVAPVRGLYQFGIGPFSMIIYYFAVAAAPSQGRLYCSAKNELPILFEDIEKGCVIREIFLDGKLAGLV